MKIQTIIAGSTLLLAQTVFATNLVGANIQDIDIRISDSAAIIRLDSPFQENGGNRCGGNASFAKLNIDESAVSKASLSLALIAFSNQKSVTILTTPTCEAGWNVVSRIKVNS